jgi:hypothetical protein
MGDISEEDYERLNLQQSLEYRDVTISRCMTLECAEFEKEVVSDSEVPPHSFIYANERMEDGHLALRNLPIKAVCATCMIAREEISTEYFKKSEEPKFRFSATKAKGDRGKNYFKDFSKTVSNTQTDPEIGKGASNKVTKKDEENFINNMKGKI